MRFLRLSIFVCALLGFGATGHSDGTGSGVTATAEVAATERSVTVTYPGGRLLIPTQMFREEVDPSVPIDIKEVALRLGYPELNASHRPSKRHPGHQELISLDDAVGIIIVKPNTPIAIPYEQRFLTPVGNDLDPHMNFESYSLAQKGMPERLTHYVYYRPEEPRIYIGCSGQDPKKTFCSAFFDELGLRWGVVVPKRFLTNNVQGFREKIATLVASFQAN